MVGHPWIKIKVVFQVVRRMDELGHATSSIQVEKHRLLFVPLRPWNGLSAIAISGRDRDSAVCDTTLGIVDTDDRGVVRDEIAPDFAERMLERGAGRAGA